MRTIKYKFSLLSTFCLSLTLFAVNGFAQEETTTAATTAASKSTSATTRQAQVAEHIKNMNKQYKVARDALMKQMEFCHVSAPEGQKIDPQHEMCYMYTIALGYLKTMMDQEINEPTYLLYLKQQIQDKKDHEKAQAAARAAGKAVAGLFRGGHHITTPKKSEPVEPRPLEAILEYALAYMHTPYYYNHVVRPTESTFNNLFTYSANCAKSDGKPYHLSSPTGSKCHNKASFILVYKKLKNIIEKEFGNDYVKNRPSKDDPKHLLFVLLVDDLQKQLITNYAMVDKGKVSKSRLAYLTERNQTFCAGCYDQKTGLTSDKDLSILCTNEQANSQCLIGAKYTAMQDFRKEGGMLNSYRKILDEKAVKLGDIKTTNPYEASLILHAKGPKTDIKVTDADKVDQEKPEFIETQQKLETMIDFIKGGGIKAQW